MSLLAQIFAFGLTPHLWAASSLFDGPPISTYRTVVVTSEAACSDLCRSESDICAGNVTLQPDIRSENYICYLNDGLKTGSPFEILPPVPLDLDIALADLNAYRTGHGLTPLSFDARLNTASLSHAQDMADHGIASHSGTDGTSPSDRVLKTGYQYSVTAENVATGQESWDRVFKAWQDSPGHNVNLLLPDATDFGIALVYERTTQYRYYWAMIVAAPLR